MNIRDNIKNYLFDKEYIVAMYEDYVYVFNYRYLEQFLENRIVVSIDNKKIALNGSGLSIVKITKEEILVKGIVSSVEVIRDDK